jgi:tryptophan synthase alpha chain
MNRIDLKFKELKKKNRKAFIVFITAGYPNLEITRRLILELAKIGVDIIELGIPFSDPLADGPVIQESSQASLQRKTNLNDVFSLVKSVRRKTNIPICFMSYYNPIFCFGQKNFIKKASCSGVDGVIVPDLPPEEGQQFMRLADKANLDTIFFISPTTSKKRMRFIVKISKGFIYYVSLTGVTGARRSLPADLIEHVKLVKRYTWKPVCVGFGVSSFEQVKLVQSVADGVIVGSAVIKKIKENIARADLVKRVGRFVYHLVNGQ